MPLSAKRSGPDPGSALAWQILAPISVVFLTLLILAGLAARSFFQPLAMERDLQRAERYAKFCAVVFGERLPSKTPQQLAGEFHRAGLETLQFLPPGQAPAWRSPRFIAGGPFVEAWSPATGSDGSILGAVVLRRQADAVVFVGQATRAFVLASCTTFVVLFAAAWLLLERRVIERLRKIIDESGPSIGTPAPGADIVDQTRNAMNNRAARWEKDIEPMKRLLDGHHEMACISKADGTLLAVNEAYCRFFGRTREQLIGANYLDLIPPSDRIDAINCVRKMSHRNPVSCAEHRVLLPDGSTRWMRWRDTASFDREGNVTEIVAFGNDITAEKELADRIESLRIAFDQMQSLAETGGITWDIAADHMEWTPQAHRLLGADASTPASIDRLLAMVAPNDRETVRQLFATAKELGRNFEHEFRVVRPDGSVRILQSRAEVLADKKTKLLNKLTCTLRDITALREAEAAAIVASSGS